MADELDPVLESLLRSTLRAEAASIPFRLRAKDVRPSVARTKGPGWGPILLAATVALVGLSVGGVLLAGAFKPAPRVDPTAPPAAVGGPLSDLASFERLEGVVSPSLERVVARGEGHAPADATTLLRSAEAIPWVEVDFACSGPGLSFGSAATGPAINQEFGPLSSIACDGGILRIPLIWPAPDAEHGLVVNAMGGTAWRAVVMGRPLDVPERAASTAALPGLLPFDQLLSSRAGHGPEVARGSGVGDGAGTSFTMPASTADNLTLGLSCSSGVSEIALGTADTLDAGFGIAVLSCDSQQAFCIDLPDIARGLDYSTLRIRVSDGASWEAVLAKRATASSSPAP
jgi:hypothetical protein